MRKKTYTREQCDTQAIIVKIQHLQNQLTAKQIKDYASLPCWSWTITEEDQALLTSLAANQRRERVGIGSRAFSEGLSKALAAVKA